MKTQRGVALITAIVVVAIATVIATYLTRDNYFSLRRSANVIEFDQARAYALGAESWAKTVLSEDRKDNNIDHLGEDWAVLLPVLPIQGGFIEGEIIDLQGRLNLNALLVNNDIDPNMQNRFALLWQAFGQPEESLIALADWTDADIEPRNENGAEDDYYLGLTPSYRAGNQPMVSSSELRLVKGINPDSLNELLPYLAALPEFTTINVNTAPIAVLQSLGMSQEQAESVAEARIDTPFESVDEFIRYPDIYDDALSTAHLGVNSQYFLVRSTVELNRQRLTLYSVLFRDQNGIMSVLQRAQNSY